MAGLISKKILCMHGGLSPELTHLDQIRAIPRPCEPQDRGMLIDLLWSDPTNKGDGWFYSPRGISYAFGKGVMTAACKILGIDLVIRAHQVCHILKAHVYMLSTLNNFRSFRMVMNL